MGAAAIRRAPESCADPIRSSAASLQFIVIETKSNMARNLL